ncbi:hypothetical protein GTU73_18105 [Rathayibacter sp. VKM Ac-2804]|uniref:hypothetical protein n=1 Tax=unclassified Rathayibacter TaxID=2609250 RepID=UPI00132F017D|nr:MULTISPECIES: hypothetical protein [unclassified Rathayibacter]NRG41108.1 hypothetical protein [Rathayibacter sp. VKM Ac-2835]QHF25719.1 hypothetical protein GTU73_18105 [Rathayibacter sp. VKM Ac-2804]
MMLLRTVTIGVIASALLGLASATPATAAAAGAGATPQDPYLAPVGGSVSHVDDSIHAHLEGGDVVIDLSAGLLRSRTRIVVLVNDRYVGETYSGSAYYASRWSIGDRVFLRMGPAKAGDRLEVSVIGGRPGEPIGSRSARYPLLEEELRGN